MRDVLEDLLAWWSAGEAVGMATVVSAHRSTPRAVGATLLAGPDGRVVGSVSGGCVDGAVYDAARVAQRTGRPSLHAYGFDQDDPFAPGLMCGGTVEVLAQRVDRTGFPELADVVASVADGTPVAVVTRVAPGPEQGARLVVWLDRVSGSLGDHRLDAAVTDDARGMLAAGLTERRHYGQQGERGLDEVGVLVQSFATAPRLIVFGAIDFAAALARVGSLLGYRVTACDARPLFATPERVPDAEEVVVDWPHRYLAGQIEAGQVDARTAVCVLTHDPKFDVPALTLALRSPAGYVGAMGSRAAHADRLVRLRDAGVTEAELARLRSPIGLDIQAATPEETAVSIAAEIVASRSSATGRPLAQSSGPIHRRWATVPGA